MKDKSTEMENTTSVAEDKTVTPKELVIEAREKEFAAVKELGSAFLTMAKERWSVRKFKPEQISDTHMSRILEAGRHAPSAHNNQSQRVLILQSDEAIAKVRSVTRWAFNAPTVLLVCTDLTESWKNVDGHDSGEIDAAIALDHMMLEAWECGVGSTWVRGFDEHIMHKAFDLPSEWKVVAIMPMGYPLEKAHPANFHFTRKEASELYRFL
ncbi:MAG: nitroreductase family protein [Atopobiaceae bacterium]|nr:nitroreductase family protein [Atopobiaceae bacterium]